MARLTYQVLDDLFTTHNLYFEVTNVDVRRLRDDRSEIQLGQDIAFVATAAFRASATLTKVLAERLAANHLAAGDELLVIGPDAELRSDKLELDEDSVALWLKDHFEFTFLLNGVKTDAFRSLGEIRVATPVSTGRQSQLVLPWIRLLNTAAVKDDYIDVDVQITPPAAANTTPEPADLVLKANFDDGSEGRALDAWLELRVHPELVGKLGDKTYHLDLGAPGHLQLAVRFGHPPSSQDAHGADGSQTPKPVPSGGKPKHT
jgi:hypothetical protein